MKMKKEETANNNQLNFKLKKNLNLNNLWSLQYLKN